MPVLEAQDVVGGPASPGPLEGGSQGVGGDGWAGDQWGFGAWGWERVLLAVAKQSLAAG